MTSYSDIEDLWDDPRNALNARQFYWKCLVYITRILVVYFVCQYLFIPKT